MQIDLIQQYFAQTGFPEMAQLMEAVRHGVPVDVFGGDDLFASMQYGNHPSAHTHYDVVWQRLAEDITWGRVVVLHKSAAEFVSHLRISPLGVSSSKEKLRVIWIYRLGKGGQLTSTLVSMGIRHSRRRQNPKRVGSCLPFCDAFVPCGRPSAQMSLSILQKWMSRMPLGDFMWHGRKHLRLRTW